MEPPPTQGGADEADQGRHRDGLTSGGLADSGEGEPHGCLGRLTKYEQEVDPRRVGTACRASFLHGIALAAQYELQNTTRAGGGRQAPRARNILNGMGTGLALKVTRLQRMGQG